MRCGRFAVLSFAFVLTGLLAASLARSSTSTVVACCVESVDIGLAGAGTATPMPDGDAPFAEHGIGNGGFELCGPAAARLAATPLTIPSTGRDALDAHSGRAPPLA